MRLIANGTVYNMPDKHPGAQHTRPMFQAVAAQAAAIHQSLSPRWRPARARMRLRGRQHDRNELKELCGNRFRSVTARGQLRQDIRRSRRRVNSVCRGRLGWVVDELYSTASSYHSVISGLTSGPWQGPSSVSMAAAAAPMGPGSPQPPGKLSRPRFRPRPHRPPTRRRFAMTVPGADHQPEWTGRPTRAARASRRHLGVGCGTPAFDAAPADHRGAHGAAETCVAVESAVLLGKIVGSRRAVFRPAGDQNRCCYPWRSWLAGPESLGPKWH